MHASVVVIGRDVQQAFTWFDAVYREGFDAACAWLTSDPGSGQAATWTAPGTELVRLFLAGLAHDACSRRRTLTLLRGARPPALSAVTMSAPRTATVAIFHVPPLARPLLTAAHHFAHERLRNPRQRLFTAPQTTTEIVLAAAANSRITLPDSLSDLTATW